VYLQQARQHERPHSLETLDRDSLFPNVEIGDQFLYEQSTDSGITLPCQEREGDRNIRDSDLLARCARWHEL